MKNLKYILFIPFFTLFFSISYGQQDGFSKFFRYEEDTLKRTNFINNLAYDSLANEVFFCINTYSFAPPAVMTWAVLTKIDINGNMLQQRLDTITDACNEYDVVLESKNKQSLYWGGFVNDYIFTDSSTMDFLITKTDKNLNRIWRKRFVNPGIRSGYLRAMVEDQQGNLTILGTKVTHPNQPYPAVPDRFYLTKIDSMGDIIWEKTIGDNYYNGQEYYNNGSDILQDDQTGYLAIGRTFSYGETNGTAFAIKADPQGNELWHQFYMQNYYISTIYDINKTKETNESYINVGQVVSEPNSPGLAFANKIDGNGNELWHKTFQRTPLNHAFRSVTNTSDNSDIVICGSTKIDFYPASPQSPTTKGWLIRLDQNGHEVWNRMITHDMDQSGFYEYLYRIIGLKDGSILAVGSSGGVDSWGKNTSAGWVIKVNSMGCLFADCRDVGIRETELKAERVTVYPNPTNGLVSVQKELPFHRDARIRLIDAFGRELKELASPGGKMRIEYDLSEFKAGVYILQIIEDGERIQKKITLLF